MVAHLFYLRNSYNFYSIFDLKFFSHETKFVSHSTKIFLTN